MSKYQQVLKEFFDITLALGQKELPSQGEVADSFCGSQLGILLLPPGWDASLLRG